MASLLDAAGHQAVDQVGAETKAKAATGSITRVPAAAILPHSRPGRDERAEPVYLSTGLSTGGVVEEIARRGAEAPVGVVAFADHLYRAAMTSRRHGFDAFAPERIAMPAEYDRQSGQPWCRSRAAYLLHDIMIRVTERRAAILHAAP